MSDSSVAPAFSSGHPDLFVRMGFLVLERGAAPDSLFSILGRPEWARAFLNRDDGTAAIDPVESFPFLQSFLPEAERLWASPDSEIIFSGPWVENSDHEELHLEARALNEGSSKFLLVELLSESFEERRNLLQRARQNSLNYESLVKEVQKKEILLHCIVHDLAGPLTGLKGMLSLLGRESLSEKGRRRLEIGQQAIDRLDLQIRDLLNVFSAELEALEATNHSLLQRAGILAAADFVVETLRPAASLRGLTIEVDSQGFLTDSIGFIGETKRLERILFNLVENALRFSPQGGTVNLKIQTVEDRLRLSVSDQGPGVEEEFEEQLFGRFVRGDSKPGKAGLGLYFCRIVVTRWGGQIGYQPNTGGGALFWFELVRPGTA